jgi:hypothetical protein
MPAPRMRDAVAPRPFVVQHLTALVAPMDIEDEREDEIVNAVAANEATELYKPWQIRFRETVTAVMAEESSRADRALRCENVLYVLDFADLARWGSSVPGEVVGTAGY